MRLDKWLKVSRLIKRRTVANEACDNARVTANGRPVKASYDVKAGDVLELRFGERTVKVEVLAGWITNDFTSATLASKEKISRLSMKRCASSCPPLTSKVKIEPAPFGK